MNASTGRTKNAGWQMGVRRTFPLPPEAVWEFLLGEGIPLWLGTTEISPEVGDPYVTGEGVRGEVRSRMEGRRVRLTWQPSDWSHDATLQLTVLPAATGATVAIHQERLASATEREEMLVRWTAVLDDIRVALTGAD